MCDALTYAVNFCCTCEDIYIDYNWLRNKIQKGIPEQHKSCLYNLDFKGIPYQSVNFPLNNTRIRNISETKSESETIEQIRIKIAQQEIDEVDSSYETVQSHFPVDLENESHELGSGYKLYLKRSTQTAQQKDRKDKKIKKIFSINKKTGHKTKSMNSFFLLKMPIQNTNVPKFTSFRLDIAIEK